MEMEGGELSGAGDRESSILVNVQEDVDKLMKREHDSLDDFEHLEKEGLRRDVITPPSATVALLEAERESRDNKFHDLPSEHEIPESFQKSKPDRPSSSLMDSPLDTGTPPKSPPPELKTRPALIPDPVPISKPTPVPQTQPSPSPPLEVSNPQPVIEAEVIFCQMGLDAWFDPQRLHPRVESLIYWRCPARSGAALGGGLALLVALACCSVVSVFAYVALLALSAAVAFRVYRSVLQAIHKTNEGHPFKWLLESDINVRAERAQAMAAGATAHLNAIANELRRLFLVEDLVDSLKFGVLLWCLTYVGACFNGITLIILAWVALFTLPKAYELNKAQVDANLELARAKINEISTKVRAAVPLGKKSESDKEK